MLQPSEQTFIDKTEWGAGPWVTEPDRVIWQDPDSCYWCLANRNTRITGSWCGYVAVPSDHPYFGKTDGEHTESSRRIFMRESSQRLRERGLEPFGDDDLSDVLEQHPDYEPKLHELDVHGGVTFTGNNEKPTQAEFEQWRKHMLLRQPEIEQYPNGDAAQDWQEQGQFIDDFDGWYRTSR